MYESWFDKYRYRKFINLLSFSHKDWLLDIKRSLSDENMLSPYNIVIWCVYPHSPPQRLIILYPYLCRKLAMLRFDKTFDSCLEKDATKEDKPSKSKVTSIFNNIFLHQKRRKRCGKDQEIVMGKPLEMVRISLNIDFLFCAFRKIF